MDGDRGSTPERPGAKSVSRRAYGRRPVRGSLSTMGGRPFPQEIPTNGRTLWVSPKQLSVLGGSPRSSAGEAGEDWNRCAAALNLRVAGALHGAQRRGGA
jgi:hypothetical protein